jgi:valyl-tRNA synthetase
MQKVYNPQELESRWSQRWASEACFTTKIDLANSNYCIMLPPPNVTGSLHMGHAFQDTIMDVLIRYNRMNNKNTLWQVGTDHAGIATQMVVERQLQAHGQSRHDLGREKFIEKVWEWKELSKDNISSQLKRLGASVDWAREKFTLDPELSAAVQHTFISLYREGLIYRGKRLVNWDPILKTAISDLEVEQTQEEGHMWHIRYPLANSDEFIVVATTRPETMLGDTAVAVNPDDPRYQHLIGKQIQLPLSSRLIPIIADNYVTTDFGTGCVKITPAHDFNDNQIGARHNLASINIMTLDAKINDNAPVQYQGLDRYQARKQIVADLETLGLLVKVEKHTLMIPRGDRSKAVIEPMLTDQWFVKIASLAKPAKEVVANGSIKFIPENWTKTYFEWMDNIEDWCISRQLWWGHRVPAWYDNDNNIYVGTSLADVKQHYNLADSIELFQDEDVLDTWFSSALWPFSTLGWPNKTPEFKAFFPTNVLVTGFDIIFFWVARMIMFSLKFTGQVPFKEVYIHGLIQDQEGQKMSKTKGNVIDPIDVIDGISLEDLIKKRTTGLMQPQLAKEITNKTKKQFPQGIMPHGTDALRFNYCALATNGRHLRFDMSRLETHRNFCNKLWNASRYVLMKVTPEDSFNLEAYSAHNLTIVEQWIMTQLQHLKSEINRHIQNYRFDLASDEIYNFVWKEYCDWFIELSKPMLNSPDHAQSTKATLIKALAEILHIIHPFMPFITEEIWSYVNQYTNHKDSLLAIRPWPNVAEQLINAHAIQEVSLLKEIIINIRNILGQMNIASSKVLELLIEANEDDRQFVQRNQLLLSALLNLKSITFIQADVDIAQGKATTVAGNMKIYIPLAGLIDLGLEKTRLAKEINKLILEVNTIEQKLNNSNYITKAPAEVIAKEQKKMQDLTMTLQKLQHSLTEFN